MQSSTSPWRLIALLAPLCVPAYAAVQVTSLTPSIASPQVIGTSITWTATASDPTPGQLAFQFNVSLPGKPLALAKDFDNGTIASGGRISLPFVWVPTTVEGTYHIQVVAKDVVTGQMSMKTVSYTINPLVTGSTPVVVATANPLVALFSAPSCAAGSSMRISFQPQTGSFPAVTTNYVACHPPTTMNFEIAGMYPKTAYNMFSQTKTGGSVVNGPTVMFTTGALPITSVPFPPLSVVVKAGPNSDLAAPMVLINPIQYGGLPVYANVATDLAGKVMWYYNPGLPQSILLTRPLPNGTMLTFQSDPNTGVQRYMRQIDLGGNVIKETNINALSAELVAMGVTDAQLCSAVSQPPAVGAACIGSFNHDAIQTLPNGETAVIINLEKIYPAGTQGDTTGLPIDVVGDMVLILNSNWQVIWSFNTFDHAGGAPQLDINRAAVLGEICTTGQTGCPPMYLIAPGFISPQGKDWLHSNSLYYSPVDGSIMLSSRHQDWVMKIDYSNGAGTNNILWRMGPCGDFIFNNIYNDPWPWQSHQHEAAMENNGAGPLTLYDNGNTRTSRPGSSTGCIQGLSTGDSRGMSLSLNESTLQVTPVLSVDLGNFSTAAGSAQLLSDGNYFFFSAIVFVNLTTEDSFAIEIKPTPGTATGTQVHNLQSTNSYRGWRLANLYFPPTT